MKVILNNSTLVFASSNTLTPIEIKENTSMNSACLYINQTGKTVYVYDTSGFDSVIIKDMNLRPADNAVVYGLLKTDSALSTTVSPVRINHMSVVGEKIIDTSCSDYLYVCVDSSVFAEMPIIEKGASKTEHTYIEGVATVGKTIHDDGTECTSSSSTYYTFDVTNIDTIDIMFFNPKHNGNPLLVGYKNGALVGSIPTIENADITNQRYNKAVNVDVSMFDTIKVNTSGLLFATCYKL